MHRANKTNTGTETDALFFIVRPPSFLTSVFSTLLLPKDLSSVASLPGEDPL
jgi:hypothetical protein